MDVGGPRSRSPTNMPLFPSPEAVLLFSVLSLLLEPVTQELHPAEGCDYVNEGCFSYR